jgi:hypothetical protein
MGRNRSLNPYPGQEGFFYIRQKNSVFPFSRLPLKLKMDLLNREGLFTGFTPPWILSTILDSYSG